MKDLKKLSELAIKELNEIGIYPSDNIVWKVNTRAQKCWGTCMYRKVNGGYQFKIDISERLLKDNASHSATMSTIIHELLHAMPECISCGHTGKWRYYANKVNANYPEYNIQRVTSSAEKGVEPPKYKYAIECENCGKQYKYLKKGKYIRMLESGHYASYGFRCAKCGSHNLSVKNL